MTTKNLSSGAVQLLDVITKMPGHFREDYCKVANLSRSMWNRLSGELRRTGNAHTVRATTTRNGKEVTDFRWYPGEARRENRARKTTKTPPAVRRGKVRATERPATPEKNTAKPAAPVKAKKGGSKYSTWTQEDLDLVHSLWKQGLTDREIEEKTGRTAYAIRAKRKTMRWITERGVANSATVQSTKAKASVKPATKPKQPKKEPTYEVTIVEPIALDDLVVDSPDDVVLLNNLVAVDKAIKTMISEATEAVRTHVLGVVNLLEERVTALEQALAENSQSDQTTLNVIGELEKTLSALRKNL